jgi:hypothetical protein
MMVEGRNTVFALGAMLGSQRLFDVADGAELVLNEDRTLVVIIWSEDVLVKLMA